MKRLFLLMVMAVGLVVFPAEPVAATTDDAKAAYRWARDNGMSPEEAWRYALMFLDL